MKHFLLAFLLAVGIHLLTFGMLGLLWLLQLGSSSGPFLLLAYGDSSVAGFEVDVIAIDPGTDRYGTQGTPSQGDTLPTPPAPLQQPATSLEPAPEAAALPKEADEPLPTEPLTPPSSIPEPPVLTKSEPRPQTAPAQPMASAALAGSTAGGAPLSKGTPSRGGTVGSRSGVRLVGLPRPVYPREAVLRGVEGRVVLFLRISAEGRVTEVKVNESSGSKILDDAALEFGRTLHFIPARQDQQAVSATALYPVRYQLTDAR